MLRAYIDDNGDCLSSSELVYVVEIIFELLPFAEQDVAGCGVEVLLRLANAFELLERPVGAQFEIAKDLLAIDSFHCFGGLVGRGLVIGLDGDDSVASIKSCACQK